MKHILPSSLAMLLASGSAFAEEIEVSNSWVSGGEVAGKQVVIDALKARGHDWVDFSIAGYENEQAAFMARVQAGDPPGAKMYIIGPAAAELAEMDMLVSIEGPLEASGAAAAIPEMVTEKMQLSGKPYYAPISVHGESWVFYSIPVMEKIGYDEVPSDWDGFFAMLDAAKAAGVTPVAFSGQAWQTNKVFNQILLSLMGRETYGRMLVEADEEIVMSGEFLQAVDIYDRLHGYVGEGTAGMNWNDATAQVIRDEALLQFQGDWAKGEFLAADEVAGEDYGCAVNPGLGDMLVVVDSFAFPKLDGKQEAQYALAEVLLDPEVQRQFNLLKGSFPVRTDVDMSAFDICAQIGSQKMSEGAIAADMNLVLDRVVNGQLVDLINEFWAAPYDHGDFQADYLDALTY